MQKSDQSSDLWTCDLWPVWLPSGLKGQAGCVHVLMIANDLWDDEPDGADDSVSMKLEVWKLIFLSIVYW